MLLSKLLSNVENVEYKNFKDIDILSICDNTKEVKAGALFCCVVGEKYDAHNYVKVIAEYGCKAFLVEYFINGLGDDIIQIKVDSVRKQMCKVASNFYDNPAKKMDLIGVTGTNGKTSITFILKNAFEKLKLKVGVIGTTGYYIGNAKYETKLTTPDVLDLYKIFNQMVAEGVEVVVMEVSAHSVYFDKIYGLKFKIGIFTNLTQDHLDFFETMTNYGNYKFKFLNEYCENVVINADDEFIKKLKFNNKIKSYAIKNLAYLKAENVKILMNKIEFDAMINKEENVHFTYPNGGVHNLYNVLASLLTLKVYGIKLKRLTKIIAKTPQILGRLDYIKVHQYFVCIDYAHTPDALNNVLSTVRPFTDDLIVVFGSSGNRDSLKREEMGTIVSKYADYIILTSDNPRYEKETDILNDLSKSIKVPFVIESDRAKAIKYANEIAKSGSIIVICGKGVETYQDINAIKVAYSDYDEVKKYI